MTTKNQRVEYNFLLKFPTKPFTLQALMKKYPKVSYITLYMRVKRGLKDGTIVADGVKYDPKKRGRSQKVYSVVAVPAPEKVVEALLPV